MKRIVITVSILTLILTTAVALAQPRGPGKGRRGNGPPQAAINACKGKAARARCTIQTPRGTISGTCRVPPRIKVLACIPDNHRRGRPGQGQR